MDSSWNLSCLESKQRNEEMADTASVLATQLSGQIATPSAWLVGTAYTAGQAVSRSGLNYYAISGSTGVDPATDAGVHWGLLSGVGPQPGTMTALFNALMTGLGAMLASRIARRVGILNTSTGNQWNCLPPGVDSGAVAQNYLEIREVSALQGNLQVFASNIARVNDPMVLNTPASVVAGWASQLVAYAASYEALEVEVLPA